MTRHTIPWWNTAIGEAEKHGLLRAFDQRRFTTGSVAEELERRLSDLLDVPHVVLVNSGTSALTISMLVAGVGPGDEVIVPDFTWVATAQAAALLGARVIAIDSRPDHPNMDLGEVERKLSDRTRVILPMHFHGRANDMLVLRALASQVGAVLVEDACKALMCRTPRGYLGTVGDIGCFSLGMISLFSIGYGGFLVTRNDEFAARARLLRDHGVERDGEERLSLLGSNFKVSDLLAAVGIEQIKRVDEKLSHVHKVYDRYLEGLANLNEVWVEEVDLANNEVPLCVDVMSPRREELIAFLNDHGVGASRLHKPMHTAPYLGITGDFVNATRFSEQGFMPPCGPSQSLENVDHTIDLIREWSFSLSRCEVVQT